MGDRKYHLLVADDNAGDRSLAEIVLHRLKDLYELYLPADGVTLGEAIATHPFHVAIIDVRLGWCDPTELIKKLRASNPGCRIILHGKEALQSLSPEWARMSLGAYLVKNSTTFSKLADIVDQVMSADPVGIEVGEADAAEDIPARHPVPDDNAAAATELTASLFSEAAHDLIQPVQLLVRQLDLLGDNHGGQLDSDGRELLAGIFRVAETLQTLLDAVLDQCRRPPRESQGEKANIAQTLEAVAATLKPELDAVAGRLTLGKLPDLEADKGRITRLFHNILNNAIKYRGEEPLHIHIDALEVTGNWLFSISDNGLGIEESKLDTIFKAFIRGHPDAQQQGQGLGLSICKRIIEEEGGKIWARSKPGEGTTIHFTLPKSSSNVVKIG